jgi:hypothetical protein
VHNIVSGYLLMMDDSYTFLIAWRYFHRTDLNFLKISELILKNYRTLKFIIVL